MTCVCCWSDGTTELHHPAGRDNDPLTVPVCKPCHKVLTRWGNAAGLTVDKADRTELDYAMAKLIGLTHILNLTNTMQARRLRMAADYADKDRTNRLGPKWKRLRETK
jgi:hypothetical protein